MTMPATRNRRRRRGQPRQHDEAAVRRKIIPARDATPINSLLIYARNKRGKTTLAGSASEIGKTLIIDCEQGTSSIRKKYPKAEVYKLTEFDEIDEIYWFLANKKHGYQFVVIDPISRLGQHAMSKVLAEKVSLDLAADPYQPGRQEWGKTAELLRRVIVQYKALAIKQGFFLIITAYERRRDEDEEDDESAYGFVIGPDAQPAVKGTLMGQMDIIGRLYIAHPDSNNEEESLKQIERRILFGSHEIYESGDRSDNLPRVLRQPTMKRILDRVNRR